MSINLEKLVEDLSSLTVMQAAELSKMLEEKWGVSAAAPVAVAAAGPAAAGPAAVACCDCLCCDCCDCFCCDCLC